MSFNGFKEYNYKLLILILKLVPATTFLDNFYLQQIEELTFQFSSAKEPLQLGVEASKHLAESIFAMTHLHLFGLHRVETDDEFFSVISKPHPSSKVKWLLRDFYPLHYVFISYFIYFLKERENWEKLCLWCLLIVHEPKT